MNKIREFRLKAEETQSQLAWRLKMCGSSFCAIENGKRTTQQTAQRIAFALGVAPEVLFPDFNELRKRKLS